MNSKIWLTVEGCPRSGTTALGNILNTHPDICLLHEYLSHIFFETIELFFLEEKRLAQFSDPGKFAIIPKRQQHLIPMIYKFFEAIGGKNAVVIGSKSPHAHIFPQPSMPLGLERAHIVIVRAPFATIISYIKKEIHENISDIKPKNYFFIALSGWISAWNDAYRHMQDPNYYIVNYDELEGNDNIFICLGFFLKLNSPNLIDGSSFYSRDKTEHDYEEELCDLGFGCQLGVLRTISKIYARMRAEGHGLVGWPYRVGEEICLREDSPLKYCMDMITQGFYAAEYPGRWIHGHRAEIPLTLLTPLSDYFLLHVGVVWTFEPNGEPPILNLELNGTRLLQAAISLGEGNGTEMQYFWPLHFKYFPTGSVLNLAFICENPRTPAHYAESEDNRELSVMISKIRLENFVNVTTATE